MLWLSVLVLMLVSVLVFGGIADPEKDLPATVQPSSIEFAFPVFFFSYAFFKVIRFNHEDDPENWGGYDRWFDRKEDSGKKEE